MFIQSATKKFRVCWRVCCIRSDWWNYLRAIHLFYFRDLCCVLHLERTKLTAFVARLKLHAQCQMVCRASSESVSWWIFWIGSIEAVFCMYGLGQWTCRQTGGTVSICLFLYFVSRTYCHNNTIEFTEMNANEFVSTNRCSRYAIMSIEVTILSLKIGQWIQVKKLIQMPSRFARNEKKGENKIFQFFNFVFVCLNSRANESTILPKQTQTESQTLLFLCKFGVYY